ncbi:MAG TPA: dihydrolipoamide acetyltransferase family protein [Burkholderiaceae bacterium]
MPKLGLTMTEGALAEWTLAPGARFKAGDCVFVVENDKAATEVAAESDGVMGAPCVAVGETVPVGAVVGYWDDETASTAPTSADAAPPTGRKPVTPLARRLASEHGVAIDDVTGSGPRGRVRARDVEAVLQAQAPAPAPAPTTTTTKRTADTEAETRVSATANATPAATTAAGPTTGRLQAFTPVQQTTAARLTAAKQEVPHFYLAREAEVSSLLDLYAKLKDPETEPRLTLNHFFVAAVGRALRALPELNRVWTPQGALVLDDSDVGVAVHTEHGLRVPVVRDAGRLSLVNLARQANTLAERARVGRLGADDMAGGAITVSNAGMHGLTAMTSIIVPGQSMILGVGGVRELFRPDARGQPALRREIALVLSVDHRVLDGVGGAALLNEIVDGLAHPTRLLFD